MLGDNQEGRNAEADIYVYDKDKGKAVLFWAVHLLREQGERLYTKPVPGRTWKAL